MLLGSSGGEQFLVVLSEEVRQQADHFVNAARAGVERLSGGGWAVALGNHREPGCQDGSSKNDSARGSMKSKHTACGEWFGDSRARR